MKVVCIDNENCDDLTIGKIYEVIFENYIDYLIIDDENEDYWYDKKQFKPLSEIRNEKIDKLLN